MSVEDGVRREIVEFEFWMGIDRSSQYSFLMARSTIHWQKTQLSFNLHLISHSMLNLELQKPFDITLCPLHLTFRVFDGG